jgi:Holliday junction resolvase-like predicted endonuclease
MTHEQAHDEAAAYLHSMGYTILDKEWGHNDGHLCIVAAERGTLVTVRVVIGTSTFHTPLTQISEAAYNHLTGLTARWKLTHRARYSAERIDTIGVLPGVGGSTIEHAKDVKPS